MIDRQPHGRQPEFCIVSRRMYFHRRRRREESLTEPEKLEPPHVVSYEGKRTSRPIPPIHLWKNIVHRLDLREPDFVDFRGGELFVQRNETEQMIFDSFAGVIGTGAGAQDEWPIAGLREEQFPRGLFEGAFRQAGGVRKFSRELRHAFLRDVQVRLNPFVRFVQPDAPITFFAPARRARRGDLLRGETAQIFVRRCKRDDVLIEERLAHEVIEKLNSFIPPMAKKFRVVGRKKQRFAPHDSSEMLHLADARIEKMLGVFRRHFQCGVAIIRQFFGKPTCDLMIFDSGEPAKFWRWQMRFDVIEIQIETDVAVEIAILNVAGITFFAAPDLARGIEVATECSQTVRRKNRREYAVARTRFRVENSVRVDDEPADVRFLKKIFHAIDVSAFRQPDAARIAAETASIMIARDKDLRADRLRMIGHQRQERVRRGGGDDFEFSLLLKFAKRANEIFSVSEIGIAHRRETMVIHPRKQMNRRIPMRAMNFFFSEIDQAVEMPEITFLQERIEQHRAKRRRQREREARLHSVAQPAVHFLNERDVSFRDRFEQPVFFQKLFVLRMPDKRQMRVKNECEIALAHLEYLWPTSRSA